MRFKVINNSNFAKGDLVKVKSMPENEHFCIIGFKRIDRDKEPIAILKALFNETYIIEKSVSELTSLLIKGQL